MSQQKTYLPIVSRKVGNSTINQQVIDVMGVPGSKDISLIPRPPSRSYNRPRTN